MDRFYKGTCVRKHVSDYCIMDLETTGIFINSAKIIEISAIKIRDNIVVDEFNTLVNPYCHIPEGATAVNHITDDMVKDAPCLPDVIDDFSAFVGEDVIVGYNNAAFDINLIYDCLMETKGIPFKNNYIDVLYMARRCLSNIDNYKLETVSKYYSLDTSGEHRALKDCYLTKTCYDKIFSDYGTDAFGKEDIKSRKYTPFYSSETLALRELQNLLEQIIEDEKVSFNEFFDLVGWIENHKDLKGNYPFNQIFNAIDKVLEDGKVSSEELEELQVLFADFLDPVSNREYHGEIITLCGKHICVTGDFDYGSRCAIFKLIEDAGGIVDKSVKKVTDYVVVGAGGSDSWKAGNYGSKLQKAIEMMDKGMDIKIIEEAEFIPIACNVLKNNKNNEMNQKEEALNIADWQQSIRSMLDALVVEYELPKGSLYLSDNYGKTEKNKDKIISYSVYIWEPNYPKLQNEKPGQNKLIITLIPSTVKNRPEDLDMTIREVQEADLHHFLPADAIVINRTKSDYDTGIVKVRIKNSSPNLVEYVRQNTIYCLNGYISKASPFGCCSSFEKCSDAKKCVHENKLYSKACMYRSNLEQGKIFYGKNRNIDSSEEAKNSEYNFVENMAAESV